MGNIRELSVGVWVTEKSEGGWVIGHCFYPCCCSVLPLHYVCRFGRRFWVNFLMSLIYFLRSLSVWHWGKVACEIFFFFSPSVHCRKKKKSTQRCSWTSWSPATAAAQRGSITTTWTTWRNGEPGPGRALRPSPSSYTRDTGSCLFCFVSPLRRK